MKKLALLFMVSSSLLFAGKKEDLMLQWLRENRQPEASGRAVQTLIALASRSGCYKSDGTLIIPYEVLGCCQKILSDNND